MMYVYEEMQIHAAIGPSICKHSRDSKPIQCMKIQIHFSKREDSFLAQKHHYEMPFNSKFS